MDGDFFQHAFMEHFKQHEKRKKKAFNPNKIVETIISEYEDLKKHYEDSSFKLEVLKKSIQAPPQSSFREHSRYIMPTCYIVRNANIINIEEEVEEWIV